jgi:hypothetical protein
MRRQLGEKGLLSDDARPIVLFEENRKIYRGINTQRKNVLRYKVDEGMIQSGEKCDYALGICDENKLYFIELKGSDVSKAAEQILETMRHLSEKVRGFSIFGRIVCSRVPRPDLRSTQLVRLERELARHNGNLVRQTLLLEEEI